MHIQIFSFLLLGLLALASNSHALTEGVEVKAIAARCAEVMSALQESRFEASLAF